MAKLGCQNEGLAFAVKGIFRMIRNETEEACVLPIEARLFKPLSKTKKNLKGVRENFSKS